MDINMDKHIVYIVTDSNRTYLEVGYCTDINAKLQEIQGVVGGLFSATPKLNNVVFLEEFDSKEQAVLRQYQLRSFTRMQRKRLIRMKNPNWLNLKPFPARTENKKVVVYA